MYAIFEYKQVDHPLLTIVAQHHPQPWFETVVAHLDVAAVTQHSSAGHAAVTKLEKTLADGVPAQLLVARGELPWHARPRRSRPPTPTPWSLRAHGTARSWSTTARRPPRGRARRPGPGLGGSPKGPLRDDDHRGDTGRT